MIKHIKQASRHCFKTDGYTDSTKMYCIGYGEFGGNTLQLCIPTLRLKVEITRYILRVCKELLLQAPSVSAYKQLQHVRYTVKPLQIRSNTTRMYVLISSERVIRVRIVNTIKTCHYKTGR